MNTLGVLVVTTLISPIEGYRLAKALYGGSFDNEHGAESSVTSIVWVIIGLVVAAVVIGFVIHFESSARTASTNVDSNLTNAG